MAAARDAYNEIDQELDVLSTSLDVYNNSRAEFVQELRVLFDTWVDTLVDCPAADQAALADHLGVSPAQLDEIIGRLRVINQRIRTNSDFTRERDNIMRFINLYRPILAKIQGQVLNPNPLSADEQQNARGPPTSRERLDGILGVNGAAPIAPTHPIILPGSSGSSGAAASTSLPPPRFHFPLPSGAAAATVAGLAPPTGPPPAPLASLASPSAPPSAPLSTLTEAELAYLRNVVVGSKISLKGVDKGKPNRTVIEIDPSRKDKKIYKVSFVSGGVKQEAWIAPEEISPILSLGGKSRRLKKTKKRRQKKSRKNKK